ncbi:hypothetical protein [Cryptosporangium sp. NPDC051539]|uniref:hypothetical protein n=1 Tax=Cryptosporangium sp. NPDC051539 TaxID=3363962 RepID=UPI003792E1DF
MQDGSERLTRLLETARRDPGAVWVVVAVVPAEPVEGSVGEQLQAWVREQVAVWPAPVAIGCNRPHVEDGSATFASPERYHCAFGADGSTVLALPVGGLRDGAAAGEPVWAIGEGAVAWITVAALHLAGAFAARTGVRGSALAGLTVRASGESGFQVFNRDAHGLTPVGRRLDAVRPVVRSVSVAECAGAGVAGVARPLVVDLLGCFGLHDSRHIDAAGMLRRQNFTGHDERILTWSTAIGLPSVW